VRKLGLSPEQLGSEDRTQLTARIKRDRTFLQERMSSQMSRNASLTFTGRVRSIKCAAKGIMVTLASQHNAWIHAVATIAVLAVSLYLRISRTEWCLIILAIVSVWMAEALNTAFEFLTDVASPQFHPLAEKAKDVAAGAVLITAMGSVLIGVVVLGPYLVG
jgi:diacylglycerol kinase